MTRVNLIMATVTGLAVYSTYRYFRFKFSLSSESHGQDLADLSLLDDPNFNIEEFPSLPEEEGVKVKVKRSLTKPTNFRIHILRHLKLKHNIDDMENTALNRKVLKREVINIIKDVAPDVRTSDLYLQADIIVEMFFIPSSVDMKVRNLRYAPNVLQRLYEYNRPIWLGSFVHWIIGARPLWVDPRPKRH